MTTATKSKQPTIHQGRNLMYKRISHNIKQEVLAEAYGCNQQRISQIENQKHVSDEVLQWFADFYDCSLEDLRDRVVKLEAVPVAIHSNAFNEGSNSNLGQNYIQDNVYNYNSEELILKLCAEKDRQVEQLIAALDSIIAADRQQREELVKLLAKNKK